LKFVAQDNQRREKQFGVNFDKVLVCDRATDELELDFHLTLITCSNEMKRNKTNQNNTTKTKTKPKIQPTRNETELN